MHLNHLHLHVADVARSRAFYEAYFGFAEHARHGEILFLRNEDWFDLALAPSPEVEPLPEWFHFGFRRHLPDEVRDLYERMKEDGVRMRAGLIDEEDLVSYRCFDPDGYGIEVYWE
jgi:catechol 2,3-dioxygenase-like lactoylglutathione lyase family enzyme